MGMMDQLMALKWTKANIKNFGGDPDRITIFGESAGSQAVGLHLLSPLSKDFFTRAILQSGSPTGLAAYVTRSEAKTLIDTFAKSVGCPVGDAVQLMKCLKPMDLDKLVNAQIIIIDTGVAFEPVVDGYFLPDIPEALLKAGKYKHTQIINGFTKDKMTLLMNFPDVLNVSVADLPDSYVPSDAEYNYFTSFDAADESPLPKAVTLFYRSLVTDDVTRYDAMVRLQSDFVFNCAIVKFSNSYVKTDPVYMYQFEQISSMSPYPRWMGTPHSYDIEFAFGFPLNNSYNYTQEEKDFSRIMMTYWTNFAKSGDPSSPSPVPKVWPQYEMPRKRYQVLDVRSKLTTKSYLRNHECTFMNDILPMTLSNSSSGSDTTSVVTCPNHADSLLVSWTSLVCWTVLGIWFKSR